MTTAEPKLRGLFMIAALCSAVALSACQGCRSGQAQSGAEAAASTPSVRLYVLSTLAGALEPCGCSKDQLGGLDHLAAFLSAETAAAPHRVLLAAGPTLFIDDKLAPDLAAQDRLKAESIASALKDMGLRAWTPGFNDWAGGADTLTQAAQTSGAVVLGADLTAKGPAFVGSTLLTVDGVKLGVIGLSDPRDRMGNYPEGVTAFEAGRAIEIARREAAALDAQGAQVLIALTAMPRGEALRIADSVSDLDVLVIGDASSNGHGNTAQPPPELIGHTLVVQTANHGQTVSIVDVFLRGDVAGQVVLADAGGVAKAEQLGDIARRIRELEHRINGWEKGGNVSAEDLKARKDDLERLRAEKTALELREAPPPEGSFFRYRVQEVREGLGEDAAVRERMLAYYKHVNGHNKQAFADRKPLPAADGQAHYVGADACTDCHAAAREVWDATPHAKAYETLEKEFKEYNLECVGCHVTGYGKPGGSTVTHNAPLKDVQCETCHGPGSLHVASPDDPKLITLEPDPQRCVEQCHHPPHVEGFDPKAKLPLVLGPGHGKDAK